MYGFLWFAFISGGCIFTQYNRGYCKRHHCYLCSPDNSVFPVVLLHLSVLLAFFQNFLPNHSHRRDRRTMLVMHLPTSDTATLEVQARPKREITQHNVFSEYLSSIHKTCSLNDLAPAVSPVTFHMWKCRYLYSAIAVPGRPTYYPSMFFMPVEGLVIDFPRAVCSSRWAPWMQTAAGFM